ncbi:hypothetical protein OG206_07070 [Streptomyces sp. NBC_01341]|uniref:hypothetical protein n=1 Tax=Streptomyces sp. NBC_01341 TaxID=2903831 RepID=UPI002E0EFA15|nr:hypothetical protein OG206_07070 [Streptomyces sp. NBC_01341]
MDALAQVDLPLGRRDATPLRGEFVDKCLMVVGRRCEEPLPDVVFGLVGLT